MNVKKSICSFSLNIILASLFVFIFYCLFPNKNLNLDAYYYGSQIKYQSDIFNAHHLLYNYTLINLIKFFGLANLDTLFVCQLINSFLSTINFVVFYFIVKLLFNDELKALLVSLCMAFTFIVWRYAVDNEVYVLAVLFLLLSCLLLITYYKYNKVLYFNLAVLLAGLACLYHQINVFWIITLFAYFVMYKAQLNKIPIFIISGLLVVGVYIVVWVFYYNANAFKIMDFVLTDFKYGSAELKFSLKSFLFLPINLIRIFSEVHYPSIQKYLALSVLNYIPIILVLSLFVQVLRYRNQIFKIDKALDINKDLRKLFLSFFVFYLIFILYSESNIEFMLVLAYFAVLVSLLYFTPPNKILTHLLLALFTWNFAYYIYPNNKYNFIQENELLATIKSNQNSFFIVKNDLLVNKFYYEIGVDDFPTIIKLNKVTSTKIVDSLLAIAPVYTDVIAKPKLNNRAEMYQKIDYDKLFEKYDKFEVLKYSSFWGENKIYRLSLKHN